MSRPRTLKTVAVDFDGVIHTYDKGYQDGSIYGEEIKMSYFDHDSPRHDDLMQECNYYGSWAFIFALLAFIGQIIAFVQIWDSHFSHGVIILIVSFVTYTISGRLKRKSDDYFKKAHTEEI